jgi:Zn-dependent alcohol dehydrogenase
MADLYSQGRFPLDRIVTPYSLDDINVAVDHALSGRSIKSVLCMHEHA